MFFKKKPLSETEFSKKFAKLLVKKVKGLEITSIKELEIKSEFDGRNSQHFLDNAYSEYENDPKLIKQIFQKYLNGLSEMFLPKELLKEDRILPIIKDKRFIKSLEEINPDFEANHIYEFYNDEIVIFYAEDKENSIQYISREDLMEINFPIENLYKKAIQNLSDQFQMKRHGENGYFMITAGGNYESSLILLDIWHQENFPVEGNFVIGIPSRDVLFITGTKDSKNLHRLYDSVEKINETGDHIVSDKIFELRNGKFEVLKI